MLRFCFTKINAAETAECEEKMEEKYNYRSILSFFALLARGSIYKILAIFTVLAAAEIISFYRCLKGGRVEGFQGILEGSIIPISAVFLTALSVLFFVLAWMEGTIRTKSKNILMRLKLSKMQIFFVQSIYHLCCFIMLFVLQIWIVIFMFFLFRQEFYTENISEQSLFVVFYSNDFLHCLLPLQEAGKWLRNILLLIAFSMQAARGIQRKNIILPALLFAITVSWFVHPIGTYSSEIVCGIIYLAVIIISVQHSAKEPVI